jgi:fibronectin-binding autotransporter adhesin
MPRHHASLALLSLIVLAACAEDQSPTAPTSPTGPAAEVAATAAGQRVVNSLADPGDGTCNASQCTLREAIAASGTTSITFASGLAGTITLAPPAANGGPLAIAHSLTIAAPAAGITIRRRSTDPDFRILRVGEGAEVTLTRLTLRNGRTDLQGGGIVNFGRLALVNCTVSGNTSAKAGGGIENKAVLTLTHTTVSDNSSPSGAGIDNDDGRLVATNSVIVRNVGAGIVNRGGSLKLTNSRISDNAGRGVSEERSISTLDHVTITGNTGGGYLLSQGGSTITFSTIAGNSGVDGAGIANSIGAELTVSKSTVASNTATGRGGGIFNRDDNFARVGGHITLVNSTVTGNSAAQGGGIYVRDNGSASMSIGNSTIARNSARVSGGGIDLFSFGDDPPVHLTNSVVALNNAPANPDLQAFINATFTLIGDGTGSDVTNTDGNKVGNVSPNTGPIDPRLGPLADNGGATRTLALLAGSPAIDAASADACPGKDQRDVTRPRGSACDMGSFER